MRIINRFISTVKGEDFKLDSRVPLSYVILLFLSRGLSLLWGIIRFRSIKKLFIHPSSVMRCTSMIKVGKNFSVGRNCYINDLSQEGLICGDNVSIGYNTHIELTGSLRYFGKGMRVGNYVGLGTHGHYGSGMGFLEIGDDTIFGNYVSIHPENHNYHNTNIPIRLQGVNGVGVKIGKNCWIGAKVTILDGTIIGDNSVVAAGAVVRGQFPDNCVIGGIPAKIIKYI